jgi:lysine/ornithine N-monooxygenase
MEVGLMKTCTKCGVEKELTEFSKRKNVKDGRTSQCKKCQIAYNREHYHAMPEENKKKRNRQISLTRRGITQEQYDAMYKEQQGCCAICGKHESNILRNRLNIDHCHTTGAIRGLLCHHCNAALGHLEDSVDNLTAAISYLKRTNNGL